VYGDRFLQLFPEVNLQLDCSIAAMQKAVLVMLTLCAIGVTCGPMTRPATVSSSATSSSNSTDFSSSSSSSSEEEEEENLFAKKAGCQKGLQPIDAGHHTQ